MTVSVGVEQYLMVWSGIWKVLDGIGWCLTVSEGNELYLMVCLIVRQCSLVLDGVRGLYTVYDGVVLDGV